MSIPRAALVLGVVALGSARADDEAPTVHTAATLAVAEGRTLKTKASGWGGERGAFSETNSRGGVLIGFDVGMRTWFGTEVPTAIRAVYRTPSGGTSVGKDHGSFVEQRKQPYRDGIARVVKMRARPGYAVGAINLRSGGGLDAVQLTYLRIDGERLDPERGYKSAWVGNTGGGSERGPVGGDGVPFVGVFGNSENDRVHSLGFIHLSPPPPKAKAKAAPKARAAEPKQPAEAPPPKAAVARAAPEAAATRWTHRDSVHGFKLDLPAGWAKLLFVEQKQLQALFPGLFDLPEAGFRPEKSAAGEAFVLLSVAKTKTAGRSLDDLGAELTPSPGPYREATGGLRDLARTLAPGEVALDRTRVRFVWKTKAEGSKIDTLHVRHVGFESVVTLHCHSHEATAVANGPAFAQISDSFAFDAAKAYRPPVASLTWLPMAVFAGVSAVIFVPLAIIYGRKATSRARRGRKKRRAAGVRTEPGIEADVDESIELTAIGDAKEAFAPSAGIVTRLPAEEPRGAVPLRTAELVGKNDLGVLHFTCFNSRAYRVYVLPDEVYFIDAGPGDGRQWAAVGGAVGGLLGAMVGQMIAEGSQEATRQRRDELDRKTPDELFALADGVKNYCVRGEDIWMGVIDVPGFWNSLGQEHDSLGFLKLGHQTRGELTFHFRELEDMRRAIELLPAALGAAVEVKVVLDKRKWKYVRRA